MADPIEEFLQIEVNHPLVPVFQMPLGFRNALANTRQAQYILLRSRAFQQQVIHQTTHSLARFLSRYLRVVARQVC